MSADELLFLRMKRMAGEAWDWSRMDGDFSRQETAEIIGEWATAYVLGQYRKNKLREQRESEVLK